jgi:ABC-type nitrate/sulfonate/bicarbonate transport system permease component
MGALKEGTVNVGWVLASAALAIGVAELARFLGVLNPEYFPSAANVAVDWGKAMTGVTYWSSVWATVSDALLGLTIAVLIAVPLGILIGKSTSAFHATRFVVEFLRPIPSVAIIPLVVLLAGTGSTSKVILAAFAAVFPILIQSIYGVRDIDPVTAQTAVAFRLGRARTLLRVTLPSALPFIVTGIRISAALALLVTVSAEIIVGAPGIGQAITLAEGGNALGLMYAYIVTAGLLGVLLNTTLSALARHFTAWSPGVRTRKAT